MALAGFWYPSDRHQVDPHDGTRRVTSSPKTARTQIRSLSDLPSLEEGVL